jgi:hypothetical protein
LLLLLTWVWHHLLDPSNLGLERGTWPKLLGCDRGADPSPLGLVALSGLRLSGSAFEPVALKFGVRMEDSWVKQVRTQGSWVLRYSQTQVGLAFKRGPKLLDLALQSDSLKLGSDKFNIIINIKNMIICIINILICIIVNIINIIIYKFKKQYY